MLTSPLLLLTSLTLLQPLLYNYHPLILLTPPCHSHMLLLLYHSISLFPMLSAHSSVRGLRFTSLTPNYDEFQTHTEISQFLHCVKLCAFPHASIPHHDNRDYFSELGCRPSNWALPPGQFSILDLFVNDCNALVDRFYLAT